MKMVRTRNSRQVTRFLLAAILGGELVLLFTSVAPILSKNREIRIQEEAALERSEYHARLEETIARVTAETQRRVP